MFVTIFVLTIVTVPFSTYFLGLMMYIGIATKVKFLYLVCLDVSHYPRSAINVKKITYY